MKSIKKTGRLVGLLFLIIFATGITVYQILQGPVLFSDDFLTSTSANSDKIIISTALLPTQIKSLSRPYFYFLTASCLWL